MGYADTLFDLDMITGLLRADVIHETDMLDDNNAPFIGIMLTGCLGIKWINSTKSVCV